MGPYMRGFLKSGSDIFPMFCHNLLRHNSIQFLGIKSFL